MGIGTSRVWSDTNVRWKKNRHRWLTPPGGMSLLAFCFVLPRGLTCLNLAQSLRYQNSIGHLDPHWKPAADASINPWCLVSWSTNNLVDMAYGKWCFDIAGLSNFHSWKPAKITFNYLDTINAEDTVLEVCSWCNSRGMKNTYFPLPKKAWLLPMTHSSNSCTVNKPMG
jgi:hypothetical protein